MRVIVFNQISYANSDFSGPGSHAQTWELYFSHAWFPTISLFFSSMFLSSVNFVCCFALSRSLMLSLIILDIDEMTTHSSLSKSQLKVLQVGLWFMCTWKKSCLWWQESSLPERGRRTLSELQSRESKARIIIRRDVSLFIHSINSYQVATKSCIQLQLGYNKQKKKCFFHLYTLIKNLTMNNVN